MMPAPEHVPVTEVDVEGDDTDPSELTLREFARRLSRIERRMRSLRRWVIAILLASKVLEHNWSDSVRHAVAAMLGTP